MIDEVYALTAEGRGDDALDVLGDGIDTLLGARDYAAIGALLDRVDLERLDPSAPIFLLGLTTHSRGQLPGRLAFLRRVEARLNLTGENVAQNLEGLR